MYVKSSLTVNNWKMIGNDIDAWVNSLNVGVIGFGQPAVAMIGGTAYNNLIRGGLVRLDCYEHNPQSTDFTFRNNVLLQNGLLIYEMEDTKVYDNIFELVSTNEATTAITTQRRDVYALGRVSTLTYSDYNNFHTGSRFTTNRYALDGGSEVQRMSLASWQAQVIDDGFETIKYNNPDSNSTVLDPQFDADYITQNIGLATSGRFGGRTGLEYKAGPNWSNI